MNDDILIEARGLSRRYGPRAVVSGLNLTLRKGEILGLLGQNGAGKSTTMKMLAGVLAPSAGSVTIAGASLATEPKRAKRNLGYLPEQPPVYPELTVHEYLHYCAGLHDVPAPERKEAVAQAMRSCNLGEVAQRLIGNLSKGFQQRVGIAQAIVHRPAVVILDEPTVGLDPIQIREIRALIKELGEQHGVILSSHILPEIQAVCGRAMIINKGRLVYSEALVDSDAFNAVFATFRNSPNAVQLKLLPGIADVESLGDGRWRIAVAPGSDPREALATAAVHNGWGLLELRADRHTLEEIFIELTSGDSPDPIKDAA